MLQAINNSHWYGYIEHFKTALPWKRCNKEARKLYYNDCRLDRFIYKSASRILVHAFVSNKSADLEKLFQKEEKDKSKANYLCFVAKEFAKHVEWLTTCNKDWLRCNAIFLTLA